MAKKSDFLSAQKNISIAVIGLQFVLLAATIIQLLGIFFHAANWWKLDLFTIDYPLTIVCPFIALAIGYAATRNSRHSEKWFQASTFLIFYWWCNRLLLMAVSGGSIVTGSLIHNVVPLFLLMCIALVARRNNPKRAVYQTKIFLASTAVLALATIALSFWASGSLLLQRALPSAQLSVTDGTYTFPVISLLLAATAYYGFKSVSRPNRYLLTIVITSLYAFAMNALYYFVDDTPSNLPMLLIDQTLILFLALWFLWNIRKLSLKA